MKKIDPAHWVPADGMILEKNALDVVKGSANYLVVAGPGAGKTELLAQKASFLLQTNTCRFPHKILAISFKKDAAFNLRERVKSRCGDELSRRFDSFTFDSFAKQILDRFHHALPPAYAISAEYDVILKDQSVLDYYESEDLTYYNTTHRDKILNLHTALALPLPEKTNQDQVRLKVWKSMINGKPSVLSFRMIMRLAEFIITSNPNIKRFLQETYHYVFLDEFQDSTDIQYDFFKSCFLGSSNTFTAVGDDKQRIMGWAGAKTEIFNEFMSDTHATMIHLIMNFRSAPRLVTLLNHLTKNLLGKTEKATASPKWNASQGECSVWTFENPKDEMTVLLKEISGWIKRDNINPSEICILVKSRLEQYVGDLIIFFNENGLKARDESKFQDLLCQELVMYIVHTLYLIFNRKSTDSKAIAFAFLANIHTEFEEIQMLRLENSYSLFLKKSGSSVKSDSPSAAELKTLIDAIITYANKDRIRAAFPAYKDSKQLDYHINELKEKLVVCCSTSKNILEALDQLVGIDTIPVMTVHKSKGLEYHTVIFVGLEDNAFFSFDRQPDEDKCTFFVALSRAKERVVFTFSKTRENNKKRMETQSLKQIEVFFKELEKSGVVSMGRK